MIRDTAIRLVHPEARTIANGEKAWDTNSNLITLNEELIAIEVTRLQAEYDAQEYARKRKEKYDALNQMELISDDSINGTTTHKDAILAIKAEFPKP